MGRERTSASESRGPRKRGVRHVAAKFRNIRIAISQTSYVLDEGAVFARPHCRAI
jgi:hypothetical protein